MRKDLLARTLAVAFLVLTLSSLAIFSARLAESSTVSELRSFAVTHPNAPVVAYVTYQSATPTEGANQTLYFIFNVTDPDGAGNLNNSKALVRINASGVERNSTSCAATDVSATMRSFNCSVVITYYDSAGNWTVNSSIADNNQNAASNSSQTFTYGSLKAMTISRTSMGFGTVVPGAADQASANNPLQVNNTGNQNLVQVNVTAYDLVGAQNSSYTIQVGNFSVNISDSAAGIAMVNATAVTIPDAVVSAHNDSTQSAQSLYLYLDVPTGLKPQNYSALAGWVVTVS